MLLDNLGIVEFSSCLDFTMCQPKKQVEGSYWRCTSCKEIYYNRNKKANSTEMLYFFYPRKLGKKSKSNGNTEIN